jgi:hypothetical protein
MLLLVLQLSIPLACAVFLTTVGGVAYSILAWYVCVGVVLSCLAPDHDDDDDGDEAFAFSVMMPLNAYVCVGVLSTLLVLMLNSAEEEEEGGEPLAPAAGDRDEVLADSSDDDDDDDDDTGIAFSVGIVVTSFFAGVMVLFFAGVTATRGKARGMLVGASGGTGKVVGASGGTGM